MATKILTQARLKELLHYDADTGVFTNLVSRQGLRYGAGSIAGAKNRLGYIVIQIDKVKIHAHRLAWLYVHGAWPTKQIDHINRKRDDNRLVNLRDVSASENIHNSSFGPLSASGVRNVVWHKRRKKWQAQIMVNNKYKYLGMFDDIKKAQQVAEQARQTYHPTRAA
jgi:hypothetical protein